MKKIIILMCVALLLSGCGYGTSTPADINYSECEFSYVKQYLCSARIGDVILFEANKRGGSVVYLKKGKNASLKKMKKISKYSIYKITSSDKYFYVSAEGVEGVTGGRIFVLDREGKIIKEKECSCEWIYVYGDTILGYYNGHDESDGVDGWTTERIEATHCIDEKDFLDMKKDDISKWTKMTGDFALIEGKKLIRQVDSKEMVLRHKEPYYTDTVYDEVYTNGLASISYVDGRIRSAETLKEKVRKYIKQLHEIMGKREKNFCVGSWQEGEEIVGVCSVYKSSGGFLQHYTKDIKYGFTFHYDKQSDTISLVEKYDNKDLIYYDKSWVIYSDCDGNVYKENLETKEKEKIFEATVLTWVDVSDGIVAIGDNYDVEDKKAKHKEDAIILR